MAAISEKRAVTRLTTFVMSYLGLKEDVDLQTPLPKTPSPIESFVYTQDGTNLTTINPHLMNPGALRSYMQTSMDPRTTLPDEIRVKARDEEGIFAKKESIATTKPAAREEALGILMETIYASPDTRVIFVRHRQPSRPLLPYVDYYFYPHDEYLKDHLPMFFEDQAKRNNPNQSVALLQGNRVILISQEEIRQAGENRGVRNRLAQRARDSDAIAIRTSTFLGK